MIALTNLLAFLALVGALLVVWRRSSPGRLRIFAAQSAALTGLAVTVALFSGHHQLLGVAVAFAVIKVGVVPRVLARMTAGGAPSPVIPRNSTAGSLLAAGGLVVVAYVIMLPVTAVTALPTAAAIPLAFATALIGLFVCVTGRDAFAQILGFLLFENGVFALALLGAYGLPLIVEAGVFLDVLVIVLIMEGVVVQMRREHASIEVDRLRTLRG